MAIRFGPSIVTPPPPSVVIGTQTWMLRNLDVARYRNGDPIPEVYAQNLPTYGAWCYYNNDPAYGEIYGKLYNWYAVNDSRGLAPNGWHVPSGEEFTNLVTYAGGSSVAGGALKEAGTTHWRSPNIGATNSSGWTGLPGGYQGLFISDVGSWWSSTPVGSSTAQALYISNGDSGSVISSPYIDIYLSVRCLKY